MEMGRCGLQSCVWDSTLYGCYCSGPQAYQVQGKGWVGLTGTHYWWFLFLRPSPWIFLWQQKVGTSGGSQSSGFDFRPPWLLPHWPACHQAVHSRLLSGCCPYHPKCILAGRKCFLVLWIKQTVDINGKYSKDARPGYSNYSVLPEPPSMPPANVLNLHNTTEISSNQAVATLTDLNLTQNNDLFSCWGPVYSSTDLWYSSFWMFGPCGPSGSVIELRFFRGRGALLRRRRRTSRSASLW